MIASRFLLLLFIAVQYNQVAANGTKDFYQSALSTLYKEYLESFKILNETVDKCSIRKNLDYNYSKLASKIPSGLSKKQLAAALLIMKKQHGDKCSSSAIGNYLPKAAEIKQVIKTIHSEKLELKTSIDLNKVLDEIEEIESLLFSTPPSYFKLLSDYQSISPGSRKIIESIDELKSNYNLVRLLESMEQL